jgi:hypothetical protein
MKKTISLFLIFIFYFFNLFNFVLAYDDKTTHPALTQEIIEFYNLHFDIISTSDVNRMSI